MTTRSLNKHKLSPCPVHGFDYAVVMDRQAVVCMADTPGEITDKCWWHLSNNRNDRTKHCPDCKRCGIISVIKYHDNYCLKHKCERSYRSKVKHGKIKAAV